MTTTSHMVTMNAGNAIAGPAMADRTVREQRDRIRAAFLNGLGREPGTHVVADRGCAWDLAAAVAVLAWEGIITCPVHDLTVYGCLGLDGRVTDGVVTNGTDAMVVTHLRDLASVVDWIGRDRP